MLTSTAKYDEPGPNNFDGNPVICLGSNVGMLLLQIGGEVVSAALAIGPAEAVRLSLLAPRFAVLREINKPFEDRRFNGWSACRSGAVCDVWSSSRLSDSKSRSIQSGGIIKLSRRTNKAKGKVFQPSSRQCLVASTTLPTRTQYLMISQWPPAVLARRNIHYGWAVVAITFLTALITAGTVGAPGVFIVPLQKEFGWTTAEISSALSIRFILFGLMAPFAAALHNRFGVRNVTRLALLVVLSALVLSLVMTKVWQLMLLWGVVVGIGTGMTALVLGATIATRWFSARRGLVIGTLTASTATGQLVFLPLLANLTDHFGWRIALGLMCGMIGLAALAVSMVMRDHPGDVGLRPFGDTGAEPLCAPPRSLAPIIATALGALRDPAKTTVFWILFATFFICGASTTGLVQVHLIPMCVDYGIPQVQAAGLLAAMGRRPAGYRFVTIIDICCAGIMACADCRCCSCRSPIFRSTACRYSR